MKKNINSQQAPVVESVPGKKKSNIQKKPDVRSIIDKSKSLQKELIIILVLFLAAFFIRSLYLYQSQNYSTLSTSLSGPASIDEAARVLVKDGKISKEFFWHAPFYTFFLAFLYWISGSSILFVKIIQITLGSLTVVLVYLCAKNFLKKHTALIGAGLAALCFPLIFFEAELYSEGLAALFCVLLVFVFIKIIKNPNWIVCFLTGLIGATSVTTRPVFLIFFVAGFGWCVWSWIQSKTDYRKIILYCALIILGLMIILIPICFINLSSGGEFTFLPYSGGINSYIGNNPDYKYTMTIRPGYAWDQLLESPRLKDITGDYEKNRYFNNLTWDYIFIRPFDYMKGIFVKTIEFFSAREIPGTEDIYIFREKAFLLSAGVWKINGFGFPFGILFPLALIGLWGYRKKTPVPVFLMLVFYPLAVVLIFVSSRYRVPLLPVICILSAGGITWLYEQIKERKFKTVGISIAAMIATAVLISLPGPFIKEKMNLKAEFYLSEGQYYLQIKDTNKAIIAFKQALTFEPSYSEALYMLGSTYGQLKYYKEAEETLNKLLDLPLSSFFNHTGVESTKRYIEDNENEFQKVYKKAIDDTRLLLGNLLAEQNRLDEAALHFQKIIENSPGRFDVIEVLGNIRFNQKNYKDALSLYTQMLIYNSNSADFYMRLAFVYQQTGDIDNAIKSYLRNIELQPTNSSSYYYLGNIYFDKNEINKAIEYYQAASKLTSLDPYSLYKLGLCYMKLGDYKSAESALARSLQIKPDNPQAQAALKTITR